MQMKSFTPLADLVRDADKMPATIQRALYAMGVHDLDGAISADLLNAISYELLDFCSREFPGFDRPRWFAYIARHSSGTR